MDLSLVRPDHCVYGYHGYQLDLDHDEDEYDSSEQSGRENGHTVEEIKAGKEAILILECALEAVKKRLDFCDGNKDPVNKAVFS